MLVEVDRENCHLRLDARGKVFAITRVEREDTARPAGRKPREREWRP